MKSLVSQNKKTLYKILVVSLICSQLLFTNQSVSAGCGPSGGTIFGSLVGLFTGNPGVGTLLAGGDAAGCAAEEMRQTIEVFGAEAQELVTVAGHEGQQIIRVAGEEAEQVAETVGAVAENVLIVGSNETQAIIRTTGEEVQQTIGTFGDEAQETIVVASLEAQQFAHVVGAEARATAARIGAESREVILVASNESQKVVQLVGAEAQAVVRVAGEEARLTLAQFHEQNTQMLEMINNSYRDNLDLTIEGLDEGSRRPLRNFYDTVSEINHLFGQDLFLIEDSTIRIIKEGNEEVQESIRQLELSTSEVIVIAGQTTVYVVDRTTNNAITVISILLLAVGLLMLIYLFFVHSIPTGARATFVYSFMVIYLIGSATLMFSPTTRAYAMRSAQVGLRAELKKEAYPQIFSAEMSLGDADNGQPRIEIEGVNLRSENTIPSATIGGKVVTVNAFSDERIVVPLDEAAISILQDNGLELILDFGEPNLVFPIRFQVPKSVPERLATALPTPVREVLLQVSDSEAAVTAFAGPGGVESNFAAIGELENDIQYEVVGRNSEQSWWAINWSGSPIIQAWVSNTFVELTGNPIHVPLLEATAATITPAYTPTPLATATPRPTSTPTNTPQPTPTPSPQVTARDVPVNVRLGDGISYNAFGHGLPAGETATLLATNRSHTWGKIQTSNGTGWISLDSSIVEVAGNLDSLPIENPLPIVANDEISMNEDISMQIAVLSNDQGNFDIASLKVVQNERGQANVNGNKIFYVPPTNFFGNTTVSYEICDESTCLRATIFVHVQAVNDAPSFVLQRSQLSGPNYPGLITIEQLATSISSGPNNESNQTLEFVVTTNNPSLFNQLPEGSTN